MAPRVWSCYFNVKEFVGVSPGSLVGCVFVAVFSDLWLCVCGYVFVVVCLWLCVYVSVVVLVIVFVNWCL